MSTAAEEGGLNYFGQILLLLFSLAKFPADLMGAGLDPDLNKVQFSDAYIT